MSGVVAPLFHPRIGPGDGFARVDVVGGRWHLQMDQFGRQLPARTSCGRESVQAGGRVGVALVRARSAAANTAASHQLVELRTHLEPISHASAISAGTTIERYMCAHANGDEFWIRTPLTYRLGTGAPKLSVGGPGLQHNEEAWSALRAKCEYNSKIHVALEITADLPSSEELKRWLGEPVRAVLIPTSIFLTNRKGYPTLSQRHQKFFAELFRFNIQYYFSGRPRHRGSFLPYVQYMHFLYSKKDGMDAKALFEAPYLDYLQAPLQPLMDNLESQTYETFEQDAFKYNQYEKAITKALQQTPENKESVVMVVGAGRGPLVRCALRAAMLANRKTRMFAVEKNPNAVITLRNLKISERWDNVTIIASDMRHWKTHEKADIMVSELLGSFGDNELSPECLDGAQAFLHENGISIPCAYTSYAAPIMSSKLWNEVKVHESLKSFETPYVVRLHNMYTIAESKAVFTFTHPKFNQRIDNRRYEEIPFHAQESAVVHGFAGYFDAVLFDDVTLSINPATHSDGMFSWFPIFFPLRDPVSVSKDEEVKMQFWRLSTNNRVWYEWALSTDDGKHQTPIHNPNGRSYWIGL
ncbi:Protein arginine n-methyltransferase, partial [Globisporangium splendens]